MGNLAKSNFDPEEIMLDIDDILEDQEGTYDATVKFQVPDFDSEPTGKFYRETIFSKEEVEQDNRMSATAGAIMAAIFCAFVIGSFAFMVSHYTSHPTISTNR